MLEEAIEHLTAEIGKRRAAVERQNALLAVGLRRASSLRHISTSGRLLAGISVAPVRRWRPIRTGPPYRKIAVGVRYSRAEVPSGWKSRSRNETDRRSSRCDRVI